MWVLAVFKANAAFLRNRPSRILHVAWAFSSAHAKEIKAQCGGIIGIAHALHADQEAPAEVKDIYACIQQAIHTFGSLERLPYPAIVQTITHFEGRKKRNRRS